MDALRIFSNSNSNTQSLTSPNTVIKKQFSKTFTDQSWANGYSDYGYMRVVTPKSVSVGLPFTGCIIEPLRLSGVEWKTDWRSVLYP